MLGKHTGLSIFFLEGASGGFP